MKQVYLNNKDERALEKILDYKDGWDEHNHYTIKRIYIGEEGCNSIIYCRVVGYSDLKKIHSSELPLWLRLKIKIKEMM